MNKTTFQEWKILVSRSIKEEFELLNNKINIIEKELKNTNDRLLMTEERLKSKMIDIFNRGK